MVWFYMGMFSLRKRIEDSLLRAEMLAPIALDHEEVRHVKQEEIIHDHDLWDDPRKLNEILIKLADSAKVVDALKHLKYKAEEAKLIKELAELDTVNYELFKQAYFASVDLNKFLNKYETSKFLKKSYDLEGACPKIESRCGDIYLEQGHAVRLVERYPTKNGGIKSATIEFEFKYAYGYLSGERGVHRIIETHKSEFNYPEGPGIGFDIMVIKKLLIDEKDLLVSCPSSSKKLGEISSSVSIQHILTGVEVQSTGENLAWDS
ncbi:peptide chain release factor 3, chloroplastic [Olea europaea subsp. europaea]|uniref:Peptide chain release factor 3, chloroplastic n=1 Tax=Olea europaea subsp. europaea TaxID=158383 RepID=A0A8S0RY21_OLEEU|nr:peptide chain release factor 3, chloroplastic [Olea europaea subsp. europaea]